MIGSIIGILFGLLGFVKKTKADEMLAEEKKKRLEAEAQVAGLQKRAELAETRINEDKQIKEAIERGDTDEQIAILRRDFSGG